MVFWLPENINTTWESHNFSPEEQLDLFTPDELNQENCKQSIKSIFK